MADSPSPKTTETLPRWDLTEYYKGVDDPKIDEDLKEDLQTAIAFEEKYKGRVATLNADELARAIQDYEARHARPTSPLMYARLMKAIHQTDQSVGALQSKTQAKGTEVVSHLLFWPLELQKLDPEKLEEMYEESAALKHYKPYLGKILKETPYTLSDEVEMALKKRGPASTGPALHRLYQEHKAARRFPFPDALLKKEDEEMLAKCKEREGAAKQDGISMLTETEIRKYAAEGETEAIREAAYRSLMKVYAEGAHKPGSPAFIMNSLLWNQQISDDDRGFKRPDSARHLSNDVEPELIDMLVETVKANYGKISHRYLKLRARLFGGDTLEPWNQSGPLPDAPKITFSWEEARDIVLESYREFSPEMAEIAQMFFDKGWIDAEPREDKRGGAFAASNKASSHPHLFMNFHGTANDVTTLAHELGHTIHQWLAVQKQGDLMDATSLTFAETASTFGETVVFKKMLSHVKDPKQRKALLANKISQALATICGQIAYHDFETKIHAERKEGEISPKRFAELWKESHRERTGGWVTEHECNTGDRWGGIPHFFGSPFYVYAYAFGDLLATSLYKKFETMKAEGRGGEFEKKYLDLLSAASTEHHSEMLPKRFGPEFDLNKREFWQGGIDVISGMIDELEQLVEAEKTPKSSVSAIHTEAKKQTQKIEIIITL